VTGARRAVSCAALLAVLAGCGESAHDKLVADANRICRDGDHRIRALPMTAKDQRALAALTEREAAIIQDARTRLGRLEPPPDLRQRFARYLAAFDVNAHTAKVIALAARAGRLAEIQRLVAQARGDTARARGLARDLGFRDCARP
jgi:hypothetical protein